MKIVVALDSFKGSLEAVEACAAVRDALREQRPEADIVLKPMADGGEGTAAALLAAKEGEWVEERVTGPWPGREVTAGYAWFPKTGEAVVEMASASGLTLLRADEQNPLITTTYGTGQLIARATARGATSILLGVGGSATVDGGVGAAMALGWQFHDDAGRSIGLGGGGLSALSTLIKPDVFSVPPIDVLCDVDNPLCGPEGAAHVYGPQKGATPDMVKHLETGMGHLALRAKEQLGVGIRDLPGAGAAGGLAAGAVAFMGASLVSGIDTVMRASGFADEVGDADWVVTGEGRFDGQSLRGKVVSGVAGAARRAGAKVCVLAGAVGVTPVEYRDIGVEIALATKPANMPLETALAHARDLLFQTTTRFAMDHL